MLIALKYFVRLQLRFFGRQRHDQERMSNGNMVKVDMELDFHYDFGTGATSQLTVDTFDGLAIVVMYFIVHSEWSFIDTTQESRSNSREALLRVVHVFFAYRQCLYQHLGGPLKIFQRYLCISFI